jgi:hypothetical protein
MTMRTRHLRRAVLTAGTLLLVASLVQAHDLFLKLDTYFLSPHARVQIPVLNGTFDKSENFVTPERLADISVVTPRGRSRLPPAKVWSPGPDSTSQLRLGLGATGTYVAGVSTLPREIELSARDFNAYLEEDGINDVLEARRRDNELDTGAHERYSKHVKAVFQVGEDRTEGFAAVLGYPAEIVPLDNPYALAPDQPLRVRCLIDGQPVADQIVLWGGERDGRPLPQHDTRTDSTGVARLSVGAAGKWYIKFVHMVRADQPGIDYVSKWATLTFEVRSTRP